MSTQAYDEILNRARNDLNRQEQLKLAAVLSSLSISGGRTYRITDLEGLGKEIWNGTDPDEYIRQERDSWDG